MVEACAVGVPHGVKGEVVWCFCVLRPGIEPGEELRQPAAAALRARSSGKAFAPGRGALHEALPSTRSAKIVRRAVRAALLGEDPGDLSTLEDPAAIEAVRGSA